VINKHDADQNCQKAIVNNMNTLCDQVRRADMKNGRKAPTSIPQSGGISHQWCPSVTWFSDVGVLIALGVMDRRRFVFSPGKRWVMPLSS